MLCTCEPRIRLHLMMPHHDGTTFLCCAPAGMRSKTAGQHTSSRLNVSAYAGVQFFLVQVFAKALIRADV
jgi:hypothetical protein